MKGLIPYIRNYSSRFYWACTSSVTNKVLDLMPPLLVGWVIDSLTGRPPSWMHYFVEEKDPWNLAVLLAILAVAIFALESIFQWAYQFSFMKLAQEVQHDVRVDTYKKLQEREVAFFDEQRLGDTMSMLNNDVNQLERFLNSGFNQILQLFVLFIFSGYILFDTSWQLALVGMFPVPLIILGSFFYQRKISPRYAEVRKSVGALNSRLENNLAGILVIKSFTAEKFEAERVREESANYRDKNLFAIKISSVYVPLIRMLVALGFGGVLLLGSYWVLNDQSIVTAGELVLFSMMIQRLLWPLTGLGNVFDEFERANASSRRIFGLLHSEASIRSDGKQTLISEESSNEGIAIELQQLSFAYSEQLSILHDINLSIKPGESIGFAGSTGSGKSTLVKLLLRFYDLSQGKILLNGIDIRQISLTELRQTVSLVSQDIYLFYGTIFENIAYGKPGSNLVAVKQAAEVAQLSQFIESLPDKYDSIIGERGIKLSGGQRQRLSIARAILKDAQVIVLDEATSSVDTETERAIQQSLEQITSGKTALIIAHRLSTIRNVDRIVVLEKGRIVEEGKHDELLARKSKYADLWNIQVGQINRH